ncbi:flhB HrpN YscU SpaS family protein [Pseudomonas aeruginosa]|jgi:hypothetical protein|nr:flhB HrpN YscU SpaS family protein [Pseudomonas aeruginosa]ERU33130.1 hypothetical protein Q093_04847 [Pseudomonas aeruginosa CF614]ERV41075.1 hypothetical protein Q065_03906 [Pseudomonas aeruginosa BL11]ERV75539.1 hypothetical protein Q058_04159 [Pseudomonas aeruginosa BL04]ERW77149.1 hypothetical protein Q019_05222 [Pseudomonas aeruginosa BWHPSA006]ERY43327.1 hypothetical protein Q060_06195 [Pseudomonas aeruginosa BL06]
MAESESGQDKTEEPTEKRRREAREKGQLPRSRELNTLAILMAGAGGLLIYGADLAGALLRLMRSNFELSRETAIIPRARCSCSALRQMGGPPRYAPGSRNTTSAKPLNPLFWISCNAGKASGISPRQKDAKRCFDCGRISSEQPAERHAYAWPARP